MKQLFLAALVLVVLLLGWVLLSRPAAAPTTVLAPAAVDAQEQATPAATDINTRAGAAVPLAGDGEYPQPGDPIELDPEAIASLREARLHGDPRTPPIERSAPRELPTAEELADPERYQEYEVRQERKVKQAFVAAAGPEAEKLRADIARGREMGIPEEEIAKAEEKLRRLEAMRAQLIEADPALAPPQASPTP